MKKLADDCFIHDHERMAHQEAITLLKSRMFKLTATESIPLEKASGRILAEQIKASRDIPAFNNSAVDGYAFSHADHEPADGVFPISLRIAAGETKTGDLTSLTAARIFTGAPLPLAADTVAMQEDCEVQEVDDRTIVTIPPGLKKGANCRLAGEDVESGQAVSDAGQILEPQYLAAIASTGTARVLVNKPLRVGLISSGDEILRPGELFHDGGVYDANHFMLQGLMDNPNFTVTDLGICPDEKDQLHILLSKAAREHDVILSTGGASRGEEDHFVSALETLGTCHMWQLAVKPGRPMSFGQISRTPCFALPGNPVAAFVCFLHYVRPALICLAGGTWNEPQRFPLPAAFNLQSKPDRREFLRGYVIISRQGITSAQKFDRDGSGLISGLTTATGLIEIEEKMTSVTRGVLVNFLPYSGFLR